jgi:hypothetical protein
MEDGGIGPLVMPLVEQVHKEELVIILPQNMMGMTVMVNLFKNVILELIVVYFFIFIMCTKIFLF